MGYLLKRIGGGGRDRTGVDGFAGRCITTLLPRHGSRIVPAKPVVCYGFAKLGQSGFLTKKGSGLGFPFGFVEREKSLELSTSTLARLRSTN